MTIREALASGKASLAAAGVENPPLDASLLLAEALGTSRSALLARGADPLEAAGLARFGELVSRRAGGECAAYILGRKEFYGLEFLVTPSVLVPRPDTETLVEAALEYLSALKPAGRAPRMLDLCAGSGAVAIAAKSQMPELEAWAADISAEALEVAEANAARLLPPGSIAFRRGDLFGALSGSGAPPLFDLIASNPPYVPSGEIPGLSREVRGEPALALDGGADGLGVIRGIVLGARGFLRPGGALVLEADPRQMPEIAALLGKAGFARAQTRRDLAGRERVIDARNPGL